MTFAAPKSTLLLSFLCLTFAASCNLRPDREADGAEPGLQIVMESNPRPDILSREGLAARSNSDAAGNWGVVSNLAASEQVLVENTENGRRISIPLFSGPTGGNSVLLRVSSAAADDLGISDAPVTVRLTAIRIEPRLLQR